MLIGFNIGNFLTFDGIERFSMIPDGSMNLKEHVIDKNKTSLLHGSFIYGPNASGKSNFVKSINYSKDIIVNGFNITSNTSQSKDLSHRDGSGKSNERPSYFEYILDIDGRHYSYGFEIITKDDVCTSEWLYELDHDNEDRMIFALDLINGAYDDKSTDPRMKEAIMNYRKSEQNILFIRYLSDNFSDIRLYDKMIRWFQSQLIIRMSEQKEQIILTDSKFLDKLSFYLERFDTCINGYELRPISGYCDEHSYYSASKKNGAKSNLGVTEYIIYDEKTLDNGTFTYRVKYPNENASFSERTIGLCKRACQQNGNCILFANDAMIYVSSTNTGNLSFSEVIFHHGKNGFHVSYHEESQGTRRLVDIISNLLMITEVNSDNDINEYNTSRTMIIDELECSIHTLATIELVKLFYKISYGHDMQMIATTHESKLLSLDIIRKDEVWFISVKDDDMMHSSMYSLTQFKDLSEEYICNEYLNGDFGAIPIIRQSLKGDE